MMALRVAAGAGSKVILTSSSDSKLEQVKKLRGFESIQTINYRDFPAWENEALKLTNNIGVDLVVENGGGSSLLQSLKATKRRGQVSSIGYLGGTKVDKLEEFLPLLIDRSTTLKGINIGSRRDLEALCAFAEEHKLHFDDLIAKRFDFTNASEAFRYLESMNSIGKVVITL